ncbi:MAG: hypothetical protein K6G80_08605 [Treponema sp.]|nr:hypothetical protein [Treponema sp.]
MPEKNSKSAGVIRSLGLSVLVSGAVLCSALPVSCQLTESGIRLVSSDTTVPVVTAFSVSGERSLLLGFSEPASLDYVTVDDRACSVSYADEGRTASVEIPDSTKVGQSYVFYCTVRDASGNTLDYSRLFSGYNAHPARLLLSEVRTETSGNNDRYPEFVELYVLSSGNLWGLSLVTAKGGSGKTYSFGAVDVNAGEFVTVHYMSPADGSCIDETGADITLSTARDSSSQARDFWCGNTSSCLTKSDILLLLSDDGNTVMDAVAFSATESEWPGTVLSYGTRAFESGVWPDGASREYAASSAGATGVRTLSRLNVSELSLQYSEGAVASGAVIPAHAEDWAVVVKGSPGTWNNLTLYTAL